MPRSGRCHSVLLYPMRTSPSDCETSNMRVPRYNASHATTVQPDVGALSTVHGSESLSRARIRPPQSSTATSSSWETRLSDFLPRTHAIFRIQHFFSLVLSPTSSLYLVVKYIYVISSACSHCSSCLTFQLILCIILCLEHSTCLSQPWYTSQS